MANPFIHIELHSTDQAKSRAFYDELFDWTLANIPLPGSTDVDATYTVVNVGGGTGGGMMQQTVPGAPSSWLPYVLVPDLEVATEKARALGATIIKEVTELPKTGWISVIRDPTGAMLGLWQYTHKR